MPTSTVTRANKAGPLDHRTVYSMENVVLRIQLITRASPTRWHRQTRPTAYSDTNVPRWTLIHASCTCRVRSWSVDQFVVALRSLRLARRCLDVSVRPWRARPEECSRRLSCPSDSRTVQAEHTTVSPEIQLSMSTSMTGPCCSRKIILSIYCHFIPFSWFVLIVHNCVIYYIYYDLISHPWQHSSVPLFVRISPFYDAVS